jgi:hypothetical protein
MLYNKDWDYKLNPVADVLMKAADLLEKHGHIKHLRGDLKSGMCFLGAIEAAQGRSKSWVDTPLTYEASRVVVKALNLTAGHDDRVVMANWNNEPKRTAQEVIDAMRLAAKVAVKENINAV